MAAFFIAAAVVSIVFVVMVQIHGFSADWTGGVIRIALLRRRFRCPLMLTLFALILLMSVFIFAKAIKVCFVVALWAAYLI